MTAMYVLPIDDKHAALEMVGGKGRSLARMASAGLPVPAGFLLSTAAYKRFVQENDLLATISALARPEIVGTTVSFESASRRIQELLARPELPSEIASEVRQAYRALGEREPSVAVRSSATAEDLPDASFAGQQDTYLNVRGEQALIAAIRNCWASLWTPRAMSYRHQMGIEHSAVAMAVVVQVMVPSEVSGVLFTANPTTGDRTTIVVNASLGLGEAVVSGQVTPDTYLVDRATLNVKEVTVGAKEQKIVPDGEQGTRREETSQSERGRACLSEEVLRELVTLALKVEGLFDGVPQDIEWALSGGKLWVLQSRPITNLPPQPLEVSWEPAPPARILVRRQIVENIPGPCSPLFEELYLTEGLETVAPGQKRQSAMVGGGPMFVTLNGYAYERFDFPQVLAAQETSVKRVAEKIAGDMQARLEENARREKHDLELFLASLPPQERQAFDEWARSSSIDNLAHEVTMPESDNPTYVAFNKTEINDRQLKEWREKAVPQLLGTVEKWRQLDPGKATDEELLEGVRELAVAEGMYWSSNAGHTFGVAKSTDDQLQCFLRENLPEHHFISGQFLSGFESRTMQANRRVFEIARLVRASDSLYELVMVTPAKRLWRALREHPESQPVLEAIASYLETYGHLSHTLDFVEPPLIEEPSPFFVTLKAMVANKDYDPKKHAAEAARQRQQAFERVQQLLDGLQYWQFRYRLWFARRYNPIREEVMFYLTYAWPVLRALAAELSRRLMEIGTFAQADDIYYLTTPEITEAIKARRQGAARPEYRQLAAERRELREARKHLHPPGTIPEDASRNPLVSFKETQVVNDPQSDILRGIPVSPGTVTAPASLIKSPAEFDKMVPGSVLVCPITNPAWTPLFAHATGLVTDIGGILGHGSIVAREYGIPAVVGTGSATRRVRHRQEVTVDGEAGIVRLHPDGTEEQASGGRRRRPAENERPEQNEQEGRD